MYIRNCSQANFKTLFCLFKLPLQCTFFSLGKNDTVLCSQNTKITTCDPDQKILVSLVIGCFGLADLAACDIQVFVVALCIQGLFETQTIGLVVDIALGNDCAHYGDF